MPQKRAITRADILPIERYAAERRTFKQRIAAIKQHRRIEVGPYATFYFENYNTMWHQVHEMLYIERGGEAQIVDELEAHNPLIPQGGEFVATVMFEIEDPVRRDRELNRLGGVEHKIYLSIAGGRRGRPDPREHLARRQGIVGAIRPISVDHRTTTEPPHSGHADHMRHRSSGLWPHGRHGRRGAHRVGCGFGVASRGPRVIPPSRRDRRPKDRLAAASP